MADTHTHTVEVYVDDELDKSEQSSCTCTKYSGDHTTEVYK
jgi:hypothetical protein